MRRIFASAILFAALSAVAVPALAEVFVLAGGGQVVGKLLNPKESPRKQYLIQTAEGAKITLDAKQVKQVLRPRPDEAEYERIRPTYPDTVAGQWALAQWCRDHKLPQREVHLRRVIELDPNHVDARRALGYTKVDGQWTTKAEIMIKRGYVRYKNEWKLPQEVELLKNKQQYQAAQQEWCQKVKRWRGWLGTDRDDQARRNLRAIDDPMAAKALILGLRDDKDPAVRMIYIAALGKLDASEGEMALAIAALADPVEELRLNCLDYLQTKPRPDAVAYFVKNLKHKDNSVINLAAVALGKMKDPSTIGPLIDALVTTHKFIIPKAGGPNSMSPSFGTGPGGKPGGAGLGVGGGPTVIHRQLQNQAVLDALVAITGVNFSYDKRGWKDWYAAQKKPAEAVDTRRDGNK
jgi:hypothetical protein